MSLEYNLSFTEIIFRHFLGVLFAVLGGFLAYYVSLYFLILTIFTPYFIITATLGWSPVFSLLHINHASKSE